MPSTPQGRYSHSLGMVHTVTVSEKGAVVMYGKDETRVFSGKITSCEDGRISLVIGGGTYYYDKGESDHDAKVWKVESQNAGASIASEVVWKRRKRTDQEVMLRVASHAAGSFTQLYDEG